MIKSFFINIYLDFHKREKYPISSIFKDHIYYTWQSIYSSWQLIVH